MNSLVHVAARHTSVPVTGFSSGLVRDVTIV